MSVPAPFDLNLSGKTALVCGGSSGIGAAAVAVLARQGARVIALARSEDALQKLLKNVDGAEAWVMDLRDHRALGERIDAELKRGAIEILVNNSSGPKGGPLLAAKPEEFTEAFTQHLLTNQFLAQKLVPGMRAKGYGRIVNVISTSVYAPIANLGVSNTIRGSVAAWAKTLSNEVGAFGITVNSVLPGYTNTERLKTLIAATAERTGKSEAQIIEEWETATPARRFAEPEEIAAAIGFLASPAAGFITGVALAVDGGRLPTI